tara:strand:- start:17 stop:154 length:138 start_codon:yes stop_codon:yes gene_type:complete
VVERGVVDKLPRLLVVVVVVEPIIVRVREEVLQVNNQDRTEVYQT